MSSVADAYSAGAHAWAERRIRIYGVMAELLVARSPVELQGRTLLDLGTGTGAASRPAVKAGASVIAVDTAFGMLQADRAARPPGLVADALALPARQRSFDVAVAAFSLNHLEEPAAGVREAARVLRHDGVLLASTYANDDDHPAKHAVEAALGEWGWTAPPWHPRLKQAMASWGTVEDASGTIERGGMEPLSVDRLAIPFPELGADALVRWRLGMAQSAGFVASLDDRQQHALVRRAIELLGSDPEPLVRRVIFIVARPA